MKKEHIIILSAFSRAEKSYQELIKTAPSHISISVIACSEFDFSQKTDIVGKRLQELQWKFAVIVGQSLGGIMGIQFAAHHPDMTQSLILIDSSGIQINKSRLIVGTLLGSLVQYPLNKLIDNLRVCIRILSNPIHAWNAFVFASTCDTSNLLEKIICPTLIVWGQNDMSIPVDHGKILQGKIANSKLEILLGLDHDWILHSPEKFWRLYKKYDSFLHSKK